MAARNRRRAWIGGVFGLCLGLSGCASNGGEAQATGGAAGTAGVSAAGTAGVSAAGTAGVGGSGLGAGGGAAACPEARPLAQPNGALLTLVFSPHLNGKPLIVGEPNAVAGGELTPTNVRLYVSEVELLRADGAAVPVDLVTSARAATPYGVQLLDLESAETSAARVLAPEGTYAGVRFTFGINDACNSGGMNQSPPLSASSQMVWPHVAGFLFFRYESLWTPTEGTAVAPPSVIHMGGVVGSIFAPRAEAKGTVTVSASADSSAVVRVSFDEIFRAASRTQPVEGLAFPSPEVIAGEHLRRAVPSAPIFTLESP